MAEENTSETALVHFRNALETDPQALESLSAIGEIYQHRSDSTNTVITYQEMLEVEPLNQVLRETAFALFQRYNRASAAEEVADAGIQRDPNNTDWYDLKSNACLMQEKFGCAVTELERLFDVDSTRADTAFYQKISVAAKFWMQEGGDTSKFVTWASRAHNLYPRDRDVLVYAAEAYAISGDGDNAIAATRSLLDLDPSDTEPLRRTAVMLGNAGQADRVLAFLPGVAEGSDQGMKDVLGQIFMSGANAARSASDTALQLQLGQAVFDVGTTNEVLLAYGGFFVGDALFPKVTPMRTALIESKSCTQLAEYESLVAIMIPAFEAAATATDETIKGYADQVLPFLIGDRDDTIPQLRSGFSCDDN